MVLYQVSLFNKLTGFVKENQIPIKSNFKTLSSTRNKNLYIEKKILNKSTSQKKSLSSLITPRNNTVTYKPLFSFRTPSLKIISVTNSSKSEDKVQKIRTLFEKLKKKHNVIALKRVNKDYGIKFIEKLVDCKSRSLWAVKLSFELWRLKSQTKRLYRVNELAD